VSLPGHVPEGIIPSRAGRAKDTQCFFRKAKGRRLSSTARLRTSLLPNSALRFCYCLLSYTVSYVIFRITETHSNVVLGIKLESSMTSISLRNRAVARLLLFVLQLALWPCLVLSSSLDTTTNEQEDTTESLLSPSLRRGNNDVDDPALEILFSKSCPPEGFDARKTLDLDSYISKVWYPQKATPVIYAMDQSYCTVAAYSKDNSTCTKGKELLLCDDLPRITVKNRGREGSIT
jgi:hypothetical protein